MGGERERRGEMNQGRKIKTRGKSTEWGKE